MLAENECAGLVLGGAVDAFLPKPLQKAGNLEMAHAGVEFWSDSKCLTLEYNSGGSH